MDEYIDKEKLLQKLSRMIEYCKDDNKVNGLTALFQVGDAIMDCQTTDAEEVRHAKWIYKGHHEMMGHVFQCSVCERWMFTNSPECVVEDYPYCHCGAKMDLEDDK